VSIKAERKQIFCDCGHVQPKLPEEEIQLSGCIKPSELNVGYFFFKLPNIIVQF